MLIPYTITTNVNNQSRWIKQLEVRLHDAGRIWKRQNHKFRRANRNKIQPAESGNSAGIVYTGGQKQHF